MIPEVVKPIQEETVVVNPEPTTEEKPAKKTKTRKASRARKKTTEALEA